MSENGRIKNVEIGHFYVLFGGHLSFFTEKTLWWQIRKRENQDPLTSTVYLILFFFFASLSGQEKSLKSAQLC